MARVSVRLFNIMLLIFHAALNILRLLLACDIRPHYVKLLWVVFFWRVFLLCGWMLEPNTRRNEHYGLKHEAFGYKKHDSKNNRRVGVGEGKKNTVQAPQEYN